MAPKRSRGAKSKDVGGKNKLGIKAQKIKRKRRRAKKSTFSYTLLPKHKRLARKVINKLKHETDQYMLARGVDAIRRLDQGKDVEAEYDAPTREETVWRDAKKASMEHKKWKENRKAKILRRALLRKKKILTKQERELRRKKYRVHPIDPFYKYEPGYMKSRHRITKQRFMNCVDIPLFQEVLNDNKDLLESPLWNDKLNFKNMSAEKANQLKDHLHQFDVLVDALKQGIFDIPGCDDLPFGKVRRMKNQKKKKAMNETVELKKNKSGRLSNSNSVTKQLKRRLSFPPFEEEATVENVENDNVGGKKKGFKGALKSMANWLATGKQQNSKNPSKGKMPSPAPVKDELPSANESEVPSSVSTVQVQDTTTTEDEKSSVDTRASGLSQIFKWTRKSSAKSLESTPGERSMSLLTTGDGDQPENDEPFADMLTIQVPKELGHQKRFIRTLVERKKKKIPKKTVKSAAETAKQAEEEGRHRHERAEKLDPLQRLHQDEKESDICTVTSTTTTDGYASWRRPSDFKHGGNKQEILAHKVDTTLGWRVILLFIVIWEIGSFVKTKLDDIYYWIFSSHLYRENIWLFEPTVFPKTETYLVINIQEWAHLIISGVSLSIINRENECVSLLFAFSLLLDGVLEVGMSTHDYAYLPEPIDWICVILTSVQVIWKVFIICLFIGYHYYSSGYIRKAREFKHRKTTLHNHEIKAKGTKGLQKRRMAWSWMTRHARDTNLKNLKRKYPNVKDGNFPEDELEKEIKFSETKELRLYTQKHNLNIGYPYNKLRDMKRYVFEKLEKSDYTDNDEMEQKEILKKRRTKLDRRGSGAITVKKWQDWQVAWEEQERAENLRNRSQLQKTNARPSHGPNTSRRTNLTIDASFSHRALLKQLGD